MLAMAISRFDRRFVSRVAIAPGVEVALAIGEALDVIPRAVLWVGFGASLLWVVGCIVLSFRRTSPDPHPAALRQFEIAEQGAFIGGSRASVLVTNTAPRPGYFYANVISITGNVVAGPVRPMAVRWHHRFLSGTWIRRAKSHQLDVAVMSNRELRLLRPWGRSQVLLTRDEQHVVLNMKLWRGGHEAYGYTARILIDFDPDGGHFIALNWDTTVYPSTAEAGGTAMDVP